jgi:hypothetical protein
MSTPEERMRALRWGLELLEAIQRDATVPAEIGERARGLSLRYPTPASLQELLASGATRLPQDVGSSIDDARRLLEELQLHDIGSANTRRQVTYTLRHFPLLHAAQGASDCLGGLQDWLLPEGVVTPSVR